MFSRRTLVALAVALSSCAIHTSVPRVDVIYGSAYQTCAVKHSDFPEPHAHLTVRGLAVPNPVEGDTIEVMISDRVVTFRADHGMVSVQFPAGLGGHDVNFIWKGADGSEKGRGWAYLSVWNCQ